VMELVKALPSLQEHGCSYREAGGLIRRMLEDEGTWLGHVFEHVAIELQNIAGEDVTFGKTRSTDRPGIYSVIYEYAQRDEGVEAGELALKLLCSLLPKNLQPENSVPKDWDWPTARDEYIRYSQRRALGPSTASLVRAAEERGIPWLRMNEQSLIQLGYGKWQQRIQATVTGRTSYIALNSRAIKKRPIKFSPHAAYPCRDRNWCAPLIARCLPPNVSVIRSSPSLITAIMDAAFRFISPMKLKCGRVLRPPPSIHHR
jgi:cyanophycin synthetase